MVSSGVIYTKLKLLNQGKESFFVRTSLAKKTVLLTPTPAGDDGMEVTSVTGKNIGLGEQTFRAS